MTGYEIMPGWVFLVIVVGIGGMVAVCLFDIFKGDE